MAVALAICGNLEAMGGRFDEARELGARARSVIREVALPGWMGALTQMSGWTEILAGGKVAGTLYTSAGGEGLAYLRFDRAGEEMTAGTARVTPRG
mgnify:CR=1 FL=1